jgi:hypothetical protein
MSNLISVFIINLKNRTDRKENILKEFRYKPEFLLHVVEPIACRNPAESLWLTIKHILGTLVPAGEDRIILCEDDHQFTDHYSRELLFQCIHEAEKQMADILSGGVSGVKSTVGLNPQLHWMEDFTGLQFTVIFKRFFQEIINYEFRLGDDADIVISRISDRKYLIHPFISTQKEFGYSDVTYKNNTRGRVEALFRKSEERVASVNEVVLFYSALSIQEIDLSSFGNLFFPTFIIHDPHHPASLQNIKKQFKDKGEFDLSIVKLPAYRSDHYLYAQGIKKIITDSLLGEDDIIIICEDSHLFSSRYTKDFLLKNILEAHQQGVGILLGAVNDFDLAVPLSGSRFWISGFQKSPFMIIFRKMFEAILTEPVEKLNPADHFLSQITSHKMLLSPFLSQLPKTAVSEVSNHPVSHPAGTTQRLDLLLEMNIHFKRTTAINFR